MLFAWVPSRPRSKSEHDQVALYGPQVRLLGEDLCVTVEFVFWRNYELVRHYLFVRQVLENDGFTGTAKSMVLHFNVQTTNAPDITTHCLEPCTGSASNLVNLLIAERKPKPDHINEGFRCFVEFAS